MLVFSTRIPLKETTTQESFLELCTRWVTASEHYSSEGLAFDYSSHHDYDYSSTNITFSVRHYKDEKVEISACRLENRETNIVWISDCIFLNESGAKSVLLQLNCNRKDFNTKLPYIHKPYLVRLFIESGLCGNDNGISTTDCVIRVNKSNYPICVGIMNGTYSYSMPVVYISHDYWGHSEVLPYFLAQRLGGIAHVVEEDSRQTSQRLLSDAPNSRVYGGYVGLYFPSSSFCRKFSKEYYSSPQEMSSDIINAVWRSLINRLDSTNYNWNQILTLHTRQKMKKIDAQSKQELDNYISTFDEVNHQLYEKIDTLNDELNQLTAERDRLRNQLYAAKAVKSTGDGFYKKGAEPELYLNEANDLLYSILSQVKSKYPENSRAVALITSMLEANPKTGACEEVMRLIQEALSNGSGKLSKAAKSKLMSAGFHIDESGPHYKITFHDPRYMFTVSKTPSEYREGKNLLSDIRKALDVERNI